MADRLQRLAPLAAPPDLAGIAGLDAAVAPPAARFILRGDEAARAAASRGFGVELPAVACRAAERDGRAALWLGPDEWLLLAPDADGATIAASVAAAIGSADHALIDVGHRQIGLVLDGRLATAALAHGCPLDLDLAPFPVGTCTRTLLAKTEVVLWRRAPERFHLEIARSFAGYASAFIALAARDAAAMAAAGSR